MRIGIAATADVTDVNIWSGTSFYFYNILKKHYDVTPVKVTLKRPLLSLIRGFVYNRLLKKNYFITFDDSVYKKSRKSIEAQFKNKFDVIVTFDSFLVPALSNFAPKTVLISDATFDNLLNYYEYRTNLCALNVTCGHSLQKKAFEEVAFASYSSDWAIENSVNRYGANPNKLKKLYFGSNLSISLSANELEATIQSRIDDKEIKLLFPVVYWERKGGEFVLRILDGLIAKGIPARLIVAGKIPAGIEHNNIDNIGYIDKRNPTEELKMVELYRKCHFLIMPSKADCTPIVFSEANSFAMPVITTTTGGIKEMINPTNDNGVAFDLDAQYVDKVINYISETVFEPKRYAEICKNSFAAYQTKFNWSSTEKKLIELINNFNN
jgi:glycosyltransferase involved in cell wall biosynthesis